jgi:predicted DNA-binding transcriptional regulator YafY
MATVFNKLSDAIRRKKRVRIHYEPIRHPDRGVEGNRVIEPHAMGMSKKGKKYIVRAWVKSGASFTGLHPANEPSWRLFRVENITDANLLENQTFAVRPNFKAADKQMSHVPRRLTVNRRGTMGATRRSIRIAQARAPSRRRAPVQRN